MLFIEMSTSIVLKSVALVAFVAVVWLVSFEFPWQFRQRKNRTKISIEKLLSIIEDLTVEFFWSFSRLSELSGEVTQRAMERGIQQEIPEGQLEEVLLTCFFAEPLLLVENKVYGKHSVDSEDVKAATLLNAKNPELIKHKAGLQNMCQSAIEGILPLFPNMDIPVELTKEKISEIQEKVYKRKEEDIIQLLEEFFSDKTLLESLNRENFSLAFNEKFTKVGEAVKANVIAEYSDICPSLIMYAHAFAAYSRNEDFKRKESQLEEQHKLNIQNLIKNYQPKSKKQPEPLPEKPIFYSSIKKVDAATMEKFLNSSEHSETPVLLLVLKDQHMMELSKFDSFCSFFASSENTAKNQYFYIVQNGAFSLKVDKAEIMHEETEKSEYFYFIGSNLVDRSFNLNGISIAMTASGKKSKKT